MAKYGYGAPEDALYLKAYNFAKEGHPTLLFSFEAATTKLMKSLISQLLKISVDELNNPEEFSKLAEESGVNKVPLIFVPEASLTLLEIERQIRNAINEKNITHVVLDRVEDTNKINQLAARLGVQIFY